MPLARAFSPADSAQLAGARVDVAHDFRDHGRLAVPDLAPLQPALGAGDYAGESAGAEGAYPVASVVKGMTFVLVELASVDALARLRAFPTRVRPAEGVLGEWEGLVGVYSFVRVGEEGTGTKIRTRMFLGALEDPGA